MIAYVLEASDGYDYGLSELKSIILKVPGPYPVEPVDTNPTTRPDPRRMGRVRVRSPTTAPRPFRLCYPNNNEQKEA